jgi:hypothetical protein
MSLSECRIFKRTPIRNSLNTEELCSVSNENNKIEHVLFNPKCRNIEQCVPTNSPPLLRKNSYKNNQLDNQSNLLDIINKSSSYNTTSLKIRGEKVPNGYKLNTEEDTSIRMKNLQSNVEGSSKREQSVTSNSLITTTNEKNTHTEIDISIDSMLNNLNNVLKTVKI